MRMMDIRQARDILEWWMLPDISGTEAHAVREAVRVLGAHASEQAREIVKLRAALSEANEEK